MKLTLFTYLLFIQLIIIGQINRNIICFTPSHADQINGISLGIWNNMDNYSLEINGLNIEIIGQGWITPFLGLDDGGWVKNYRQNIKGISFGLTLLSGRINGISISPTINTTLYSNGLKIGLFNFDLNKSNGLQIGITNSNNLNCGLVIGIYNKAEKTKGVQIGLINKSENLRGFQLGLWNKNGRRSLPFINWQFKASEKDKILPTKNRLFRK